MGKLSNMAHRDIETVLHPYTNLARHREVGPLIGKLAQPARQIAEQKRRAG